ncbi:O-antigen ligase family protein [Sphingomonas sp.]|uniref:O-antigen ligase family protein n=1 Tax=Sphingomonas sp. TaxID=28214 RepID=UPI0035C7A578
MHSTVGGLSRAGGEARPVHRFTGLPPVRADAAPRGNLLHGIVVVAVLLLSLFGPVMSMKGDGGHASGEGNSTRQLLYVASMLLAVAGARPWQRPARLLVLPASMVVALAWCWASLGWSIDPGSSLRRLVLTTMLIWTIFLSVDGLGYARTVVLMRSVLLAVLIVNLLAVVLMPGIGIHQSQDVHDPGLIGAWRGVLGHKNFAGAAAAVTILLLVFAGSGMRRWTRWGALALSMIFLIGSLSKTSLGITMVAIGVGMAVKRYNPKLLPFALPTLIAIAGVALLGIDMGFARMAGQLLWDPNAFTGRTEIWLPLLLYVRDHPLTGAGFGAVWNIGDAREPIFHYARGWVTLQTSAHNGFLDLVAQVGIPGLVLGLTSLFLIPLARLFATRTFAPSRAALLAAMLVFAFGHNFTESSLFERDIIVHVFLIFTIALIRDVVRSPPLRLARARR